MSTKSEDVYIKDGYCYCKRVKHWRTGNYIYEPVTDSV